MMLGKPFHAPLPNPGRIIDIGCGTGVMTTRLGCEFPSAQVYGVDLSPVPALQEKPANVDFIQGDVMKLVGVLPELQMGSVDYAFNRLLVCGMTDWPGYVSSIFSLLKPGGWLEMHEHDLIFYDKSGKVISSSWRWLNATIDSVKRKGLDPFAGSHIADYMRSAGFVDIQVKEYKCPHGPMPDAPETKLIEAYDMTEVPRMYKRSMPRILEGSGYGTENLDAFYAEIDETMGPEEGKHRKFRVAWGRKP